MTTVGDTELRYDRLLAAASDYSFTVVVGEGRVPGTRHGPGLRLLTGYEPAEYQNDNGLWLRVVHADDRPAVLDQIARVLKGETPPPLQHRLFHKDGSLRWVSNTSVPRKDSTGRVVAYDGLISDITAHKRADEIVRDTRVELAHSEQALGKALADLSCSRKELKVTEDQLISAEKFESMGTLAAGVAHEVKNPLQTLLLGLSYLAKAIPSEDRNAAMAIGEMREAVGRANKVIQELLEFLRASPHEIRPEEINSLVEQSLSLVKYQIDAAGVTLARDLGANLPPVNMDRNNVQHALINLFTNALQAMPAGGTMTVRTRVEPLVKGSATPGALEQFGTNVDVALIEVQDTGAGIDDANLSKIFDPFFTTKPPGIGTGLGLAIIKRIVDLHGGRIEIKNTSPSGVRATVMLRGDPRHQPAGTS